MLGFPVGQVEKAFGQICIVVKNTPESTTTLKQRILEAAEIYKENIEMDEHHNELIGKLELLVVQEKKSKTQLIQDLIASGEVFSKDRINILENKYDALEEKKEKLEKRLDSIEKEVKFLKRKIEDQST